MTSETGIFYECVKYSENQDLKIKFIIEDNNLSVCSDTRKVWKEKKLFFEKYKSKKIFTYHSRCEDARSFTKNAPEGIKTHLKDFECGYVDGSTNAA